MRWKNFYPRPPRGGRPAGKVELAQLLVFLSTPSARRATDQPGTPPIIIPFLSTPSARRATTDPEPDTGRVQHFYPRPPRGGRPGKFVFQVIGICISIHALREEGDGSNTRKSASLRNFYPRPPRGGRLSAVQILDAVLNISIHALREEGDAASANGGAVGTQFLSTPSARRATPDGSPG